MGKYIVYEHIFPDNKRYIGITCSAPEKRWQKGEGYKTQDKVYKAIKKYGWENILHETIIDGLDQEQAEKLEIYLISALNTIKEGYNQAIGGSYGKRASYLDAYIHKMLRGAKEFGIKTVMIFDDGDLIMQELVEGDRFNKHAADMWNEACSAVLKKWGKFSAYDIVDVKLFWWHIMQYFNLWVMMEEGRDVSHWKEEIFDVSFYREYHQVRQNVEGD